MPVTLEVLKLSGCMVEHPRLLPSPKEGMQYGVRCGPGGGRMCGVLWWRKRRVHGEGPTQGLGGGIRVQSLFELTNSKARAERTSMGGGIRARAERTSNMWTMFVTLREDYLGRVGGDLLQRRGAHLISKAPREHGGAVSLDERRRVDGRLQQRLARRRVDRLLAVRDEHSTTSSSRPRGHRRFAVGKLE
jgi:hypothetical protein